MLVNRNTRDKGASRLAEALPVGRLDPAHREALQAALALGIDFFEGGVRGNKVLRYKSLAELKVAFSEEVPKEGSNLTEILGQFREIAELSIGQSDPRYLAFPDTGNSVAALAADLLTSFLNQNLIAVDRSAPAATMVEAQLLLWLRQVVGFGARSLNDEDLTLADVGGMWTPGGNMSNTLAVMGGLHTHFPEVIECGLPALTERPAIAMAKGIEHFSLPAAGILLGLGRESLLWAEPTADFVTDPDAVERALDLASPGTRPFAIVAVAGNCRTTNVDDLEALRRVADERGLWLHVDACHGGSLLFSEAHRDRLKGIEMADSVSLDPHKGLFVTYPSSYVLFKDPCVAARLCRYQEKVFDPECLDLGMITPFFGSRGFQSLKLWAMIKHLGLSGLSAAVSARAEVNRSMTAELRERGHFVLLNQNDFYRQAFVFLPLALRDAVRRARDDTADSVADLISETTADFGETLYRRGLVCFDSFGLSDLTDQVGLGTGRKYTCMAMAIGHIAIEASEREAIWREVDEVAAACSRQMTTALSDIQSKEGRVRRQRSPTLEQSPASW